MAAPNMMQTPDRSKPFRVTVRDVNPIDRLLHGEDMFGSAVLAYYYEGAPSPGDLVVVEQMANSGGKPSFFVCAGTSSYGAVFGVGGDGAITLTQASTAAAARTTSADGACSSGATTVTSASAAFTSADIGSVITSTSFSIGRRIETINSATSVEVDHPLWQSSAMAGEALTITPPIPYTKSGSGSTTTFKLQRNLYCTTLSLANDDGDFLLNTNGFGIFCNNLLYVADGCTIHNDGADASAATAGAGGAANIYGGGGTGGTGKSSATSGAGATAANVTGSIATISPNAVISGGGGGAAHASTTPSNYAPPSTVINAFANGWPGSIPQAITLLLSASTTKFRGGAGGSGGAFFGSGGGGAGTGNGGGGGGGGGVVFIAARQILNYGTIRSNGGAGAAGTASSVNSGAGGGGGGGGGAVVMIYGSAGSNLGAIYAFGGAAGGGASGGGTGGVGEIQYVDTIDYSEGWPRHLRVPVTVPAGGSGGAAGTNGTGQAVAGQAGQSGLVWALPV